MSATCALCPHHCTLKEGQKGLCKARICINGEIISESYGKLTALALDPVEKKPLKRFHPGKKLLSIGSYGCNLSCPFCQNARIAASKGGDLPITQMQPFELVDLACSLKEQGNIGIAYTYNEPLVGYEYVSDCAKLAHAHGLYNVVVTNGYICLEPLKELLAHLDALTNLPNRKLFNDRLKLALANAKRSKKMLAVLFIDLDLFKEINDQHGHKVGDMVLKKTAQRLLSCVRETDTVARLGGDEFVILISNIESESDVHKITDKLLESAVKPIEIVKSNDTSQIIDLKLRNLQVSASIGVAIYPQHGANEKTLITNADSAMYLAKKSGKNQVKFYENLTIVTYDI